MLERTELPSADVPLYQAVSSGLSLLLARASDTKLAGLALCTDDGLETLYCTVSTTFEVERKGPDFLYSPTEWATGWDAPELRLASELLRSRSASLEFSAHVESAFSLLVGILAELRANDDVAPDVFLTVLSTDPSARLQALEDRAIVLLNAPQIIEGRRAFLARWA